MKFRPITGRLPGHRSFTYEPRYYKPEPVRRDDKRIRFERKTHRGQARSVLIYAALLFIIFWIILHL